MTEFTNPNDYQKAADRTKCDQEEAVDRLNVCPRQVEIARMTLFHGIIGLMGELGELAGIVERWLWYGQDFDGDNFIEELGDAQWYMAELHNALGVEMLEVMRANIRKLKSRYPEKFDGERAKEENRNREEEMKAAMHEIKHGLITSRVVCQTCDGTEKVHSHNDICWDCNGKGYTHEYTEQTGQGFAEPPEELPKDVFFTKNQIDKALEGQDNFAMKDFKGFPQFNTPETYRTTGSVGSISKSPEPPEDGWAVARKVVRSFVDGQNLAYALKSIDSFEEQYRKNTPEWDLGEKQRLALTGELAIEALGLDPMNTSPKDVENEIKAELILKESYKSKLEKLEGNS